jgi:hypothetical protein
LVLPFAIQGGKIWWHSPHIGFFTLSTRFFVLRSYAAATAGRAIVLRNVRRHGYSTPPSKTPPTAANRISRVYPLIRDATYLLHQLGAGFAEGREHQQQLLRQSEAAKISFPSTSV